MSESVRRALSEENEDIGILDMLNDIFAYYESIFNIDNLSQPVKVHRIVAANISAESANRNWKWRCIMSVRNQTIEPGRLLEYAIKLHWRKINGLPHPIAAIPCKDCGDVHTHDCGTQKVISKQGKAKRKRAPRVEIALSNPNKARARLERKLKEYHEE